VVDNIYRDHNNRLPLLQFFVSAALGECAKDKIALKRIHELDGVRLLWSLLKHPSERVNINFQTFNETYRQFHQCKTCKFFIQTLFRQLFSSYMYVVKAAETTFVQKIRT